MPGTFNLGSAARRELRFLTWKDPVTEEVILPPPASDSGLPLPRKRKTETDGLAAFEEFVDGIKRLAKKAEELDVPMVAIAHYAIHSNSLQQDHLALRIAPRNHAPTTKEKYE